MLIQTKNPDLYRLWIEYYDTCHANMRGYEKRTYAFFNSEKGIYPP